MADHAIVKGGKQPKAVMVVRGRGASRTRYWASGRLMRRKVTSLICCCGMTPLAAKEHWLSVRTRYYGGMA